MLEEGNAVLNPIKRDRWTYTATQLNEQPALIRATAIDLPGNEGTLKFQSDLLWNRKQKRVSLA